MKLKRLKHIKVLLLNIFIAQQKNRSDLKIKLKKLDTLLLSFLWKNGYILGYSCLEWNWYHIFLKKHFKSYRLKFIGKKVNYKDIKSYQNSVIQKNYIIASNLGFINYNCKFMKNGGLLLFNII